MQYIIHQYYVAVFYAERYIRLAGYVYISLVHIIPVKGNVQFTIVYMLLPGYIFYHAGYPVREPNATWLYPYYYSVFERQVIFNQLMSQPLQRYVELLMIEQGLQTMRFSSKIKLPALIFELVKEKCFSLHF